MMTDQTRKECIKALAYGHSVSEVCEVMKVNAIEVNCITDEEIAKEREYLRSMGYMP